MHQCNPYGAKFLDVAASDAGQAPRKKVPGAKAGGGLVVPAAPFPTVFFGGLVPTVYYVGQYEI